MDDEVEVDAVYVYDRYDCDSSSNDNYMDLEYFSTKGVVRLKISNVPFVKLFYVIDTSVTGTNIYLIIYFYQKNYLIFEVYLQSYMPI